MNSLARALAVIGGNSWQSLSGRSADEADTSIAVGSLFPVSMGILFAGHWLFWTSLERTAAHGLWIAAAVTSLLGLLYLVVLRLLGVMGQLNRAVMLSVLAIIMLVNAALAGHELVLLVFKPQVEAQTKLDAARGVTQYSESVEQSLGLPKLRQEDQQVGQAMAAAAQARASTPDDVQQLLLQVRACEQRASNLRARIPPNADAPGHAAAFGAWREQRNSCLPPAAQAKRLMAEHQQRHDEQLEQLRTQQRKVQASLADATATHDSTLKRDTPTLQESATTGFARHGALWNAVAAGRIPAWAAAGLMFMALALDAFSLLVKVLAPPDAVSQDRRADREAASLFDQLRTATVAQRRRLVRRAVHAGQSKSLTDLRESLRSHVEPSVSQDVAGRAVARATRALQQAQRAGRRPVPAMLRRLAAMIAAMRFTPGGPVGGRSAQAPA